MESNVHIVTTLVKSILLFVTVYFEICTQSVLNGILSLLVCKSLHTDSYQIGYSVNV